MDALTTAAGLATRSLARLRQYRENMAGGRARAAASLLAALLMALLAVVGPAAPAYAQLPAALPGMTMGSFFNGLNSVITQLEASARSLLAQGNNAAAQQQMLLAGILRGSIEQAKAAYADSLDLTFQQLGVAEQNAASDILDAISKVSDIERATSGDAQAAIYKAQGAANQLLNKLPLVTKVPVFYGIRVRDLTTNPREHPSDVEVYGFMLADSRVGARKPVVTVGGVVIDGALVSVQEDRLQVQLSEQVKKRLGFGNAPCNPRKSFPVAVKVFYGKQKGYWPLRWTSEASTDFNANALPGAELYDVDMEYDGVRTTNSMRTESFTTASGNVTVGCEESASTTHAFQAPANATELNCGASWINGSNLKSQSQNCAVGGTTATATGSITGLDRRCYLVGEVFGGVFGRKNVCDCPGGGSGQLQISGSFKVPESKVEQLNKVPVGPYIKVEGKVLFVTMPAESSVKKSVVRLVFRRRGCAAEFDSLTVNLPENRNQGLQQTSYKGNFKVVLRNEQITVSDAL